MLWKCFLWKFLQHPYMFFSWGIILKIGMNYTAVVLFFRLVSPSSWLKTNFSVTATQSILSLPFPYVLPLLLTGLLSWVGSNLTCFISWSLTISNTEVAFSFLDLSAIFPFTLWPKHLFFFHIPKMVSSESSKSIHCSNKYYFPTLHFSLKMCLEICCGFSPIRITLNSALALIYIYLSGLAPFSFLRHLIP